MSRSFWKRRSVGSTLPHANSLQHLANVLRSILPRSGAGPPSSKYTRSRSVRRDPKELPVGLIAERAGSPCSLSVPISPPPSTADAMALARGEPDGGGVSGDGSRIRPRAESQFTASVQLAHGKAIVTWTHFVLSTKTFLLVA